MDEKQQTWRLVLGFTTEFQFRYNDKGTGADRDGAFWHPVPPIGFSALGSVGVSDYDDINGRVRALCVMAAPGYYDVLARPVSFEQLWNDHGSGGKLDGSCWRPIPPEGYVALGDVFVSGYDAPLSSDVVCVRSNLVIPGVLGAEIWDDKGSGAKMDLSVFSIVSPVPDNGMAPNTFAGIQGYDPVPTPVQFCLDIPPGTRVSV